MNTKYYRYGAPISTTKGFLKIFLFLMLVLAVYVWTTQGISDYETVTEYLVALVSPLVMALASLMYICAWSDVGIDDQGLLVEFLWFYLRVPWKEVRHVSHVGSKTFGIWLVQLSTGLTFFHRLFSLFYTFSLNPSFIVHTQSKIHSELIREINKHISSVSK